MQRRLFLTLTAALTAELAACARQPPAGTSTAGAPAGAAPGVDPASATATQLAAAMGRGETSARQLTQFYLDRIAQLNRQGPELRAVLETNPDALDAAAELDKQRAAGAVRGPLHGLPVLIKDNIETRDRMMTTAGSLALEGWYAPDDAPLVARLRQAGAVILGKSNLSEWANIRSTHSSSGWSARGGQCRNARDPRRSPSGSSSGSAVAVAAGLCALAVGTETDGSIVSPAAANGIVGLKPTVGLVSRRGVVPIAHSQDTAGPMTRSVADAALLLSALSAPDRGDAASAPANRFVSDYTRYIAPDGLRGARLGVARELHAGNARLDRVLDQAVGQLRAAGAVVIDPVPFPLNDKLEAAELEVLLYELKSDMNQYLKRLPPDFRVRSLADLIRFNLQQRGREMPFFDQELFERAEAKGPLSDPAYARARSLCISVTRGAIDGLLKKQQLDCIVALTAGPAWLIDHVNGDSSTGGCSTYPAVAGYPHLTVPAALYSDLPVGLSFIGAAYSEAVLLRLAAGFEAARGAVRGVSG